MLFLEYPFCSNPWAGHENVSSNLLQENKISLAKRKNRPDKKKHITSMFASKGMTSFAPDAPTLRSHTTSKYVRVPLENSPLLGCWDQSEVD